jgi:oxygen-independent coproporphyrinogen-3 oxidase
MQKEKAGLYIHIPFCLSKCAYCSFYSLEAVSLIPDYIEALKKEIYHYREIFSEFDTIYFGGGTPSLLTPKQIEDIVFTLTRTYKISPKSEITLEINPKDASLEYLKHLRDIGIHRINIGIQSFDTKTLALLGRRHSHEDALTAIEHVQKAGFNHWGIDMIYGVYGQSIKRWQRELLDAVNFQPPHISCYQLSLNPQTPLFRKYTLERWPLPDENKQRSFFFTTAETLRDAGYIHYEVSNFSKGEFFKSKHNQKYWRHVPYLGLGPSANSFMQNRRWWNKADLNAYLQDIFNGIMPILNSENLDHEKLQLETLFLGFRTREGVNLKKYQAIFGIDLLQEKKTIINLLIKNKFLILENGSLRPTLRGMAVADSLALI